MSKLVYNILKVIKLVIFVIKKRVKLPKISKCLQCLKTKSYQNSSWYCMPVGCLE